MFGLAHKDDTAASMEKCVAFISQQAGVSVADLLVLLPLAATVGTEGGGEFHTQDFCKHKLVAELGLRLQRSVPYHISQNGMAERAIRALTEMACTMLLGSRLSHYM